jgi:hypothetical protein
MRIKEKLSREVRESYVTAEWLIDCVNKLCPVCNEPLYIGFKDGNTYTNISADRVDNSLCHTLDNIRPCCRMCNCSKSDK